MSLPNKLRVRLETLGCRLNLSETQEVARQFANLGHVIVGPDDQADVCILNSCTVTHVADRKSRQAIRHLKQAFPDALVVVTGCYAQMAPGKVAAMGVDLVVSNQDKGRLVNLILQQLGQPNQTRSEQAAYGSLLFSQGERTRAFVKVQDGCNNACTYCVVRIARGSARSQPADHIVADVQKLALCGFKEVVLSGVHLGCYGHDVGNRRGLFDLVHRLLQETDVPRLRLSSLEPWDLTPDFFNLWEDSRLGRHLHLPLQSGCDATLKRMARRINTRQYAELVADARRAIPDLSVTTDVMVGFPGETEVEFEESFRYVQELAFAKLHVFRYSPRPGTQAAAMPDQVASGTAIRRSREMRNAGLEMERAFRLRFLGRIMPVLWETAESCSSGQVWSGLTENYVRVFAPGGPDLRNTITPTRLVSEAGSGLRGQLVHDT